MFTITPAEIETYCRAHTTPLSEAFESLRQETYAKLRSPHMQVGLLEGRFLQLLVASLGARRILELGTFSGFSAMAMAMAMPSGGKLITCDVDPEATAIAQKHWKLAGVEERIELRLGPALETMADLSPGFDLVFVDADKSAYPQYWSRGIELLRAGGLIVVDNVLWSGRVLKPESSRDEEIARFNKMARQDERVECLMLPLRDGVMVGRKKELN